MKWGISLVVGFAVLVNNVVFAQGTVFFINRGGTSTTAAPGQVLAPVYGPNLNEPMPPISGNTSTGIPAGNTSYGSSPFLNAGTANGTWIATLWGLPSGQVIGNAANNNLILLVNSNGQSSTTFRVNPPAAFNGIVNQPSAPMIVPGVTAPGPGTATFQVRVWDTRGGTVNTWAHALADPTVLYGFSDLFMNAYSLGGTESPDSPPPFLQGLTSFNIPLTVPEPSVMVLGMVGLGSFVLLRSRAKQRAEKVYDKVQGEV